MEISDRLGKLARFYDREARKYVKGRAYLAACVMQGAALEASLQSMCFLFPEHVKKTPTYQKKRFRKKRGSPVCSDSFCCFPCLQVEYPGTVHPPSSPRSPPPVLTAYVAPPAAVHWSDSSPSPPADKTASPHPASCAPISVPSLASLILPVSLISVL